jgi:hypothetical protein
MHSCAQAAHWLQLSSGSLPSLGSCGTPAGGACLALIARPVSRLRPLTWCGVVWCGVVWCGVVWCGVSVVWCGVVWCVCGVVWCGVWYGCVCGMYGCVLCCARCLKPLKYQIPHKTTAAFQQFIVVLLFPSRLYPVACFRPQFFSLRLYFSRGCLWLLEAAGSKCVCVWLCV